MRKFLVFLVLFMPLLAFAEGAAPGGDAEPSILSVFDAIFTTDVNGFFETLFERAAAWVILSWIEFKVWLLSFSFDVALLVVESLDITGQIESQLSGLSATMYAWVSYLRILEGVNMLLSAYGSVMIMRLVS